MCPIEIAMVINFLGISHSQTHPDLGQSDGVYYLPHQQTESNMTPKTARTGHVFGPTDMVPSYC